MMGTARSIAAGSTCIRKAVGAVVVDAYGRPLATGHNGAAKGEPHCSEGHPCGGKERPGRDDCRACHAELNALIFCSDIMAIDTLYVTTSPCSGCVRYLLNTSCRLIVFHEFYHDRAPLDRWSEAGFAWRQIDIEP